MCRISLGAIAFLAISTTSVFAAPTSLSDGVPIAGISGSVGSELFFVIEVPAARDQLEIRIWGGAGDADLYVRWGAWPTTTEYDFRPYLIGNNETVTIDSPAAGPWCTMLRGYTAYSGVTLQADYTPDGSVVPVPVVPVPGAAMLGSIGCLAVAGYRLRRRTP